MADGLLSRLSGRPRPPVRAFGPGLIRLPAMNRQFRAKCAVFGDGRCLIAEGFATDRDLRARLQALRRAGSIPVELEEEVVPADAVAAAWRDASGDGTASAAELGRRLLDLLSAAAEANASDLVIEVSDADGAMVQALVNDRLLLIDRLSAEEGRAVLGYMFHAKDEGSQQSSYRRTAFQGFSLTAGDGIRLPPGVTALRCQRGPHDGGGDHLFARLLYADRIAEGRTLEDLGFSAEESAVFSEVRRSLHGGIILGGSTGDGKSTTLAVNLALQVAEFERELNIISVEDPVELRIPGVLQIAVATSGSAEEREQHFASALRHFVRVHPASGMVSEIRDREGARQVLQFVDTGHQVWTTLHVRSANGILFRLLDLGVSEAEVCKPGNIALLAKQTLLPLLCPSCALPAPADGRPPPPWLARRIGAWPRVRFRNPAGCAECLPAGAGHIARQAWTGYLGQTALAEMIRPDDAYLQFVRARDPVAAKAHWTSALGGVPLGRRIWARVEAGDADPFDALRKGAAMAEAGAPGLRVVGPAA